MDQTSQLIGLIYRSAFDPTLWEQVLKDLGGLLNGRSSILLIHDKKTKQAVYQVNHNLNPTYLKRVFAKTEVNSQAALMKRVLTGSVMPTPR